MSKTEVFAVSYTVDHTGRQEHAIVFKEPQEGTVFKRGHMVAFDEHGSSYFPANDDGEIPHRERTQGETENLGITWQFSK